MNSDVAKSESRAVLSPISLAASGFRQDELRIAIVTAVIFGVFTYLSTASALNVGVATISPSNGIILAALLLVQRTSGRCAIIAAAMVVDGFVAALVHHTSLASVGPALVDGIEISTAFLILGSREHLPFRFKGRRSLISFGIAAFAACAVGTTLACIVLPFAKNASEAHVLFSLFIARLFGLLTTAPALIRLLQRSKEVRQAPPLHERCGLLGLSGILAVAMIASHESPFGFVLLPVLIAIAYRLGPRDTSAAVLWSQQWFWYVRLLVLIPAPLSCPPRC